MINTGRKNIINMNKTITSVKKQLSKFRKILLSLLHFVKNFAFKNPENSTTMAPLSSPDQVWGIDNTPLLCEFFYTLIEYGKTTMFLWMFIEGIILYHMTTVAYSRGPEHQPLFYLFGWRK